jgi:hypothetical protein
MNTKCTKWSQNIPNDRKLFQMAVNYINTFYNLRPSKIYPNLDFWFENKKSGNPGFGDKNVVVKTASCDTFNS